MPTRAPVEPPSLLATALAYHAAGRTVFPVAAGTKWPSLPQSTGIPFNLPWKEQYGVTPPDVETVTRWFTPALLLGVSLACGATSGLWRDGVTYALEVIDADAKNAPTIYEDFCEACHFAGLTDVLRRLVIERTPGAGAHLAYLVPVVEGNHVLARALDQETGRPVAILETRGEGGQVVVAPTPPGVHPEVPERGYVLAQGTWEAPPLLTADERAALLDVARTFNTYVAPKRVVTGTLVPGPAGHRPGDKLNALADDAWWAQTLEPHGWTRLGARQGIAYWQRPGKTGKGCSATLGACGSYFFVFSSNAAPFEPDTAYSPFAAYTLLEHGGDFTASTRALGAMSQGTYVVEGAPGPAPVTPTVNGTVPVGWAPAVAPAARVPVTIPGLLFTTGKHPRPEPNVGNVDLYLTHHPDWQGVFWWDDVRAVGMLKEEAITDDHLVQIARWFSTTVEMNIRGTTMLAQVVNKVCRMTRRDLLQHALQRLPTWDGTPRLDTWLATWAGAPATDYSALVSRILPLSMVARACVPGCVCRDVVIFEGPEGRGKSELVSTLAGEGWSSVMQQALDDKEAHMLLQGNWLVEFAELDTFGKTEETRLKGFITMRSDVWIPKYSNDRITRQRRTIFIGTCNNSSNYLKGQTGNTRYLPIRLDHIDLPAIAAIREQLLAEALARYHQAPEQWWYRTEHEERLAADAREGRRQHIVYEDSLAAWLETERFALGWHQWDLPTPQPGVTCWQEIARGFLKLDTPEKWGNVALQRQIAQALQALGWEETRYYAGKRRVRGWQYGEPSPEPVPF